MSPRPPAGPSGSVMGTWMMGTSIYPDAAAKDDLDFSLKLEMREAKGKSIRGGGTGLRFLPRFARPKLDRWSA